MKVKKVNEKNPKVLLIGWDAADWQTIWPCIKRVICIAKVLWIGVFTEIWQL